MSARLAESAALHVRVRAIVQAFERGAVAEPFDDVARDLARFQGKYVAGYGRLCAARDIDPASIERACEAPAVPTDAFKIADVFAFDPRNASFTFRTSGTTIGMRGIHAIRDMNTCDAAALAFGRIMLVHDLMLPVPILVVGPSEEEAADSSLGHMCGLFVRAFGSRSSREQAFFVRNGALDLDGLRARVEQLHDDGAAVVLATSFGLVHLLELLDGEVLALPARSRVMQTGGFKGKSREVEARTLRRDIARAFAIDENDVVCEYGMTELSSQFWEATLVDSQARHGVYREPPWARVVPVDPETLMPVDDGEIGIARIEDLANVDSAFAVLAADRVRRKDGGFEILGRAQGATPRGCSIALDEMLLRQRTSS
jgi:hypothetical protein